MKGMPPAIVAARAGRLLLRDWIDRMRLGQGPAAAMLGFNRVQLNRYLNGESRPNLPNAIRIEQVTGIAAHCWSDGNERSGDGVKIAEKTRHVDSGEVNHNPFYRTLTPTKSMIQ